MFRVYVTDAVKNINDSICNLLGGSVFKKRYYDILNSKSVEDPDKTAEEIKTKIVGKLAALED